jgi:hypothetical protein
VYVQGMLENNNLLGNKVSKTKTRGERRGGNVNANFRDDNCGNKNSGGHNNKNKSGFNSNASDNNTSEILYNNDTSEILYNND